MKPFYLVSGALALLLTSCSSHTTTVLPLDVSSTDVVEGQVVTLSASEGAPFTSDTYQVQLGANALAVHRMTGSILAFVVPSGSAGTNGSITFDVNGTPYATPPLSVSAAPTVSDPMGTVTSVLDATTTNLANVRAAVTDPNDPLLPWLDAADANLASAKATIAQATPEDIAQAAQIVAANPDLFSATTTKGFFNSYGGRLFTDSVKIAGLVFLAAVVAPAVGAGAAVAAIALVTPKLADLAVDIAKTADDVLSTPSIPDQGSDDAAATVSDVSGGSSARLKSPSAPILLTSDTDELLTIDLAMHTLGDEDVGSTVPAIAKTAGAFEDLDTLMGNVNGFVPTPFPAFPDLSTVTPMHASVTVDGSTCTIDPGSISTSSVRLVSATQTTMGIVAKFTRDCTGATSQTPIEFTFDVTYSDGELPDDVTTMTAMLSCEPPCGMPTCTATTPMNCMSASGCDCPSTCTNTCGGHQYAVACSGDPSVFGTPCTCTVDGSSFSINLDSCDLSAAWQAYQSPHSSSMVGGGCGFPTM